MRANIVFLTVVFYVSHYIQYERSICLRDRVTDLKIFSSTIVYEPMKRSQQVAPIRSHATLRRMISVILDIHSPAHGKLRAARGNRALNNSNTQK